MNIEEALRLGAADLFDLAVEDRLEVGLRWAEAGGALEVDWRWAEGVLGRAGEGGGRGICRRHQAVRLLQYWKNDERSPWQFAIWRLLFCFGTRFSLSIPPTENSVTTPDENDRDLGDPTRKHHTLREQCLHGSANRCDTHWGNSGYTVPPISIARHRTATSK